MAEKRFYMDKSGDLYDKNNLLLLDFGYSYDSINCNRIIDLLNQLNDKNKQLKKELEEYKQSNDIIHSNPRFKIADYPSDIIDTLTDKKYPISSYEEHMNSICDLLNALVNKNNQLKHNYDVCVHHRIDDANKMSDLEKENEKLQIENQQLQKQLKNVSTK